MIERCVDFIGCDVFRSADRSGDCTNGGVSSKFTELYLCRDYVTENDVIEYCQAHNCMDEIERFVKCETRNLFGGRRIYKDIVLVYEGNRQGLLGGMSGGNLLYSCDGRWEEITGSPYPLSIHDRYETQEVYDMLSR